MSDTQSCLYECRVLHERKLPRRHRFVYPLFYLCVDLDELPRLSKQLRVFSFNRPNLFSLRETDYLPLDESAHAAPAADAETCARGLPLKQRVLHFLETRGFKLPGDCRVTLVTLPRLFGYQFNPVSFFFCASPEGHPLAALAEVTNTFGEKKLYPLPPPEATVNQTEHRARMVKYFYVSPFTALDQDFDFRLRTPAEKLAQRIDTLDAGRCVLHSTLTGTRQPLTDGRLLYYLLKYPAATLLVTVRIHWQALLLWSKGLPFRHKADNPELQRDLRRPHRSIAEPSIL